VALHNSLENRLKQFKKKKMRKLPEIISKSFVFLVYICNSILFAVNQFTLWHYVHRFASYGKF